TSMYLHTFCSFVRESDIVIYIHFFFQDTTTSFPEARPTMPCAQSSLSADGTAQCLSSDTGEEDQSETPSAKPSSLAPAPSESGGGDFMKRAVAFLRRSGHSSSVQSSDSPPCPLVNGHAPSVSGPAHSAYVSSDNDSEFEDADMKREMQKLREKHMKEISELQAHQRAEIEQLYSRLGRPVPPSMGFLHAVPPTGRRRRASKHKLKGSRLLNPMVQQLRNNRSNSSSMYARVWGSLLTLQAFFYEKAPLSFVSLFEERGTVISSPWFRTLRC
uniref:WNK lysine deficient protein kinase 2 n=1 Tax=Sinocyclocheilus anshuiensis TaxID=1608454 RepID=A0A671PJ88_9TELE